MSLTAVERVDRILRRLPVDKIALSEAFWPETLSSWRAKGYLQEDEDPADHFDFDMENYNPFCLMANHHCTRKIIKKTDDAIIYEDGNGVLQKRLIKVTNVPQLLNYKVKTKNDWLELIKDQLIAKASRIDFATYRKMRTRAQEYGRFFFVSSMHVFELLRSLCGHETILVAMALEPDWIQDMVDTYTKLLNDLLEILFSREGKPDGLWLFEDMGFKERSFFSPSMYRELIKPAHKLTIDLAHNYGLPVVMHSCGMVEPLLNDIIDAGIDCLQAIEIKAGMDLLKLYKSYGEKISFIGGIDTRVLLTNDLDLITKELVSKIPVVKGNFGYALHSDHSIPSEVDYLSYKHFIMQGIELGTYKC